MRRFVCLVMFLVLCAGLLHADSSKLVGEHGTWQAVDLTDDTTGIEGVEDYVFFKMNSGGYLSFRIYASVRGECIWLFKITDKNGSVTHTAKLEEFKEPEIDQETGETYWGEIGTLDQYDGSVKITKLKKLTQEK